MEKEELEKLRGGEVLSTAEAVQKYEFIAFSAPFVEVRRRADNRLGTLEFQHSPRFYFNFVENRFPFVEESKPPFKHTQTA